MDKLQYDSFYKFLVSLGIVLIALPVLACAYMMNKEFILITQSDYNNLSEFSQQHIQSYEYLIIKFTNWLPLISLLLIVIGIILILFGGHKWYLIQKELDEQIKSDTITKKLNATQLSSSESVEKVINEVSSSASNNTTSVSTNTVIKYLQVEDRYFNSITPQYSKKYHLKRNLRIGKYNYDGIAISKRNNIDIIFEVKYWTCVPSTNSLKNLFGSFYNSGVNYETIAHRNFELIIIIVSPKEYLDNIRENCLFHYDLVKHNLGKDITIKFVAEETLP